MQAQVELVPNILRRESLRLFGRFFQNYSYWQGSLIAEYTLAEYQNSVVGQIR